MIALEILIPIAKLSVNTNLILFNVNKYFDLLYYSWKKYSLSCHKASNSDKIVQSLHHQSCSITQHQVQVS